MKIIDGFFSLLFAGGRGYVAVTGYGGQSFATRFFSLDELSDARDYALRLSGDERKDAYVRTTMLASRPSRGRGKREQTSGGNVLWVDIDDCEPSVEAVKESLVRSALPPTWVNYSGRGVHAYWKLDDFVVDLEAIEGANRWLAREHGGDNCWAATQVLRVPGTKNFKRSEVVDVSCAHVDLSRVYKLGDFGSLPRQHDHPDLAIVEEALPEDFLDRLGDTLQKRIVTGAGASPDRSQNDWYVVCSMLRLGYTPGQCLTVLTHGDWYSGAKTRQSGVPYAVYTIAAATATVAAKRDVPVDLRTLIRDMLYPLDENGNRSKRKRSFITADLVNPVVEHLENHGYRFLKVREPALAGYLVSPLGEVLETSPSSDAFRVWLFNATGLSSVDVEHRMLRSGLNDYVLFHGGEARSVPANYLDRKSLQLYVQADTDAMQMVRSSKRGIQVVVNGTDNLIVRRPSLLYKGVQYHPKTDPDVSLGLFDEGFTSQLAVSPVARGLLACYALALPLVRGLPLQTYPLLHLTGPAGGGKSQTLGLLSTWLFGYPHLMQATVAASYRMAEHAILLPFDDYERMSPELQQFILTAVTGITRKKSGHDEQIVTQLAHVPMALTSVNALVEDTTRRRALVIQVDHANYPVHGYTEDTWRRLAADRSLIWSGYFVWIQKNVVPRLAQAAFHKLVRTFDVRNPVFLGLSPFLTLMAIVGSALERWRPGCLSCGERPSFEEVTRQWVSALEMDSREDGVLRDTTLAALRATFELLHGGPVAEVLEANYEYTHVAKIVHTILRDKDMRLRVPSKYEPPPGRFALEGSTTEWLATLRAADRTYNVRSAAQLGWKFRRLVDSAMEVPGFKFHKRMSRGYAIWRVEAALSSR